MRKGVIAAVLALAVGSTIFSTAFGEDVLATVKLAIFDIGNYLGINKDLEDYKTVINSSVSKNGITIQLNEVIVDKDEIIVSTTIKSDERLDESGINVLGDVYINGRQVSNSAGGSSKVIDEYTEENVISYNVENDIVNGDLDIEIVYDKAYYFYKDNKEKR